jgi:alanyl-tRNA synthetase
MNTLRGFGEKGEVILDGKMVFQLMDTKGMPLDSIVEVLRVNNAGFDVVQFVETALESKNFLYQTIKTRLMNNIMPDIRETFVAQLDLVASKKGWQ